MAWFERVVFSDETLLIWRAVMFWKAELFSFRTSHRSAKSRQNFPLFSRRLRRNTQNGRDNFTWKGGVHLCSLTSFQGLWLTKQDYIENGTKKDANNGDDDLVETGAEKEIVEDVVINAK